MEQPDLFRGGPIFQEPHYQSTPELLQIDDKDNGVARNSLRRHVLPLSNRFARQLSAYMDDITIFASIKRCF